MEKSRSLTSSSGPSGSADPGQVSRRCPMARAENGGGSTRIPASPCGLPGFKPSYGRNPPTERPPEPDGCPRRAGDHNYRGGPPPGCGLRAR
ncbi:MAG: amidase family protein [Acidimicrobiales bacterium]